MLVLHVHHNCANFHFCEWVKGCNLGVSCCEALYAGMLMKVLLIFSIFDRKNLAKSSASSSSVLLSGKGFYVVLPVSLLTRQKSTLVSFLQSKTLLLIVFWSSGVDGYIYFSPLYMLSSGAAPYISSRFFLCFKLSFTVHIRCDWTIGFVAFLSSWLFFLPHICQAFFATEG